MGVEGARPHTLAVPPPACWGCVRQGLFETSQCSSPLSAPLPCQLASSLSTLSSHRSSHHGHCSCGCYLVATASLPLLRLTNSLRPSVPRAITPLLFTPLPRTPPHPPPRAATMAAFLAPPPGVLPSSFTGHGRLPGDSRSTRRSVAGVASRPPLSVTPRAVATPPSRPVRALPPGTAATGSAAPAGGAAGPPSAAARPPPPVRWPARPSTVARYKQARYVGEPTPPRRGRLRPEFYAPRPPALGSADGTASAITSAGAGGEENEEAELPLSLRREYAWARGSGYNTATRFASTWSFLGSVLARNWLIGQRWTYLAGGMTDEAVAVRRRRLGRDVRESILQLGPTFIKYVWGRGWIG